MTERRRPEVPTSRGALIFARVVGRSIRYSGFVSALGHGNFSLEFHEPTPDTPSTPALRAEVARCFVDILLTEAPEWFTDAVSRELAQHRS